MANGWNHTVCDMLRWFSLRRTPLRSIQVVTSCVTSSPLKYSIYCSKSWCYYRTFWWTSVFGIKLLWTIVYRFCGPKFLLFCYQYPRVQMLGHMVSVVSFKQNDSAISQGGCPVLRPHRQCMSDPAASLAAFGDTTNHLSHPGTCVVCLTLIPRLCLTLRPHRL